MFFNKRKYTKPLTKGELSKLQGQEVRVHFLNDGEDGNKYNGDRIWKVKVYAEEVVITNLRGDYRSFNYKKYPNDSTIGGNVLVYKLPQIPHDIEW